jgi:ribonuclease HI
MAKKFYVVWTGRTPGIFTDWPTCKRSVDGFNGARYKSFASRAEAEAAFAGGAKGGSGLGKSGRGGGTFSQGAEAYAKGAGKKTAVAPASKGPFDVQIYCDGGCDPNPGKAGSGVAVYRDQTLAELWYGLFNPKGTNNTAELNALHQALLLAKEAADEGKSVQVLCDSMYSINCIAVWADGWKKKGWKKASGEIKNLELIKVIHALYKEIENKIELAHIKAHAGTEGNELADRMTMVAVDRRDTDFRQYDGELNIPALLSLRAG